MLALYFTGNGESGVHLAKSADGWLWKAEASSILRPLPGMLMRDPAIVKFKGQSVMVWTTGWWAKEFGLSTTKDLKTWSPIQRVPVMEDVSGALNVWAPEAVVDPRTGKLIIFWSSTVEGKFTETERADGDKDAKGRPLNHRFYYTTTPDLKAFAPPKLLWDPGFNCIDATMIPWKNQWVMVGKDETKSPTPAKCLFVATAPHPLGPWQVVQRRITESGHWAEGPTIVDLGDRLRVYYDRYMDNRWGAVESADLVTWKDVGDGVRFVPGGRHGLIFRPGILQTP